MHHRKIGRRFSRKGGHRVALFRNLGKSLLEHEMIKTTVSKAKELRRFIEPLITIAKKDSLANRRIVFSRIRSAKAIQKLFSDLAQRYESRPGGYTRVLKCGFRVGDNAPMAYIALVDRPEIPAESA